MTAAQPWPDHLLTLEEFDALPEDNSRRYELQEGVLIVTPRARPLHQKVAYHLMTSVIPQLPKGWDAVDDIEVVTRPGFPAHLRVPDVVIARVEVLRPNPPRLTAEQVLLAVEIISPGSHDTDTVQKPAEYAKAGIPHYWVIDLESTISLTAYQLAGKFGYKKSAAVTEQFKTLEPFPLSIDVPALMPWEED